VVEAQWVAEKRGRERFVCEQPPYSLFMRGIERDLLPVTQQYGMGTIVWSPLAGGWLSGRYRRGTEIEQSHRAKDLSLPENQRRIEIADALAELAEKHDLTLVDMAIAFVLEHPGVTSAIIGPRTMDQLTSQLGAADVTLDADLLDAIDAIVAPGTNVEDTDGGYRPPSITSSWRRRRGAR
jgi:aryl-alcohol dehydrogenase-like predicted oxidoreductase